MSDESKTVPDTPTEIVVRIRRVIDHCGLWDRQRLVEAIMTVLDSTEVGAIGIRRAPTCNHPLRNVSGTCTTCGEVVGSQALDRLKQAAIDLTAASEGSDDRAHEEAECDLWAAGIEYGKSLISDPSLPTPEERKLARDFLYPLALKVADDSDADKLAMLLADRRNALTKLSDS